jgi:hypothetical protein
MKKGTTAQKFGNGPSTPIKLERVRKLLPWIIKMSTRHVQRFGGEFWYIDANAGPGLYQSVQGQPLEGSALIALETLRRLDVPWRAVLIDRDPDVVARLECALHERWFTDRRRLTVRCADNQEAAPAACGRPHRHRDRGLFFADPKGAPDWPLLERVTALPTMSGIDVLVNIPTNTLKLERAAAQSARFGGKGYVWDTKDTRPLCERLSMLHKPRLLIGEPTTDRLAWSLILGSSWTGFPEWKAGQFDAVDSPIGKERLRRISLSARERGEES